MKKLLSMLLVILVVSMLIPVAFADASITVSVGDYVWAPLAGQPEGVTVTKATLSYGTIPPGLRLTYSGGTTLLEGTATTAGYYSGSGVTYYSDGSDVSWSFDASIEGSITGSVEIISNTYECEITKHPGGETVEKDGWAMFTASANNWSKYSWRLVSPDTNTTYTADVAPDYFKGLTTKTYTDNRGRQVLELDNIPYELNEWQVEIRYLGNDGNYKYSWGAQITVEGAPDASPSPSPAVTPTITTPDGTTPADNNGTANNGTGTANNGNTTNYQVGTNNNNGSSGQTGSTPNTAPQYGVADPNSQNGIEPTAPAMEPDVDSQNQNNNDDSGSSKLELKTALALALLICVTLIGVCMLVISRKK